jgi:hypothetical protein
VEHYVTLFDRLFLPQGLALHASLVRQADNFVLWVLCMDEEAKRVLDTLRLPNVRTIALSDVETPSLLSVKANRSRAEYCWTLTPFTPTIVFERDPDAARVTYLDADMFLLKPPGPIFAELERSGKVVQITDHAYDPEYDQTATSGQYCVQFMTFVRDGSERVLKWWQERCIEWCYARFEDGKFGDQKYLDSWPTQFASEVHVLQAIDTLLAPWNARRFPYSRAIAWHFHGLRLLANERVLLHGPYSVPQIVYGAIYQPYLEELRKALALIGFPIVQTKHSGWLSWLRSLARKQLRMWREVRDFDAVRRMPR